MEILPSTRSFLPCSAGFNSGLPSESPINVNPRRRHTPRMRPKGDSFERPCLVISDHDFRTIGRPLSSAFPALSPIIASPACLPTATFPWEPSRFEHLLSSRTTPDYVIVLNSPSLEPVASATRILSVVQPGSLEEASMPLSTSASYPLLIPSHAPRSAVVSQGTWKSVRRMSHKPRSLSDSSLIPRRMARNNWDAPAAFPIKTSNTSPGRKAKFHIGDAPNATESMALDLPSKGCQDTKCVKDKIRRFYALKELLTTEFGYLNDMRTLVTVYLGSLSMMTCHAPYFVRPPSSFATGSSDDYSKSTQPSVFAENEINMLTRNAGTILQLHERFLQELEATLKPFGVHVDMEEDNSLPYDTILANLDEAIQAVAQHFLREAAHFHIYKDFCASHMEALEVVRTKQRLHPIEWHTFERRCALIIPAKTSRDSVVSAPPSSGGSPGEEAARTSSIKKRKRTASLTALDGAIRSLRALTSRDHVPSQLDVHSAILAPRLTFVDYMIKPVQRICKYPLLLTQLQSRGSGPVSDASVDVTLKRSVEAMKDILVAADEARHQKDMATKSMLITSRILLSVASSQTLHLSNAFLSSLGTCLLAGSLDIIHYTESKSATTNTKVKYVGAFLYPGGYLILVRVRGKIYEPRHSFCLADFDIRDIPEEIALLSSSFCLFSEDHVIELAAACPKEKDIWLSAIHESLAESSTWTREQISSSLGILNQSDPCLDGFESDLLTTQTIPPSGLPGRQSSKGIQDFTPGGMSLKPDQGLSLTRRASSSLSLKSIFASQNGNGDTIFVRRTSSAARQQTDDGLQDVLSRACLDARTHAYIKEELFKVPQASESFSRSNSTVSMKGLTKGRLSRHETARISRHNSLPHGVNTIARRELIETRTLIVRARSHKNSHAAGGASDHEKHGPSSFLPGIQVRAPDSTLSRDVTVPEKLSRSPLHDMKSLSQHRTASDLRLIPSSHPKPLGTQPSLRRAKTIGNIFRRLSARSPFRNGAQSDAHSNNQVMGAEPPRTHGPDNVSKLLPTGTFPHRGWTISRLPAGFDNVKYMSTQRFRN